MRVALQSGLDSRASGGFVVFVILAHVAIAAAAVDAGGKTDAVQFQALATFAVARFARFVITVGVNSWL